MNDEHEKSESSAKSQGKAFREEETNTKLAEH